MPRVQGYHGHAKGTDTSHLTLAQWDYDIICFGRLLFEMALGYTLKGSLPDVEQLVGKCEYQVTLRSGYMSQTSH